MYAILSPVLAESALREKKEKKKKSCILLGSRNNAVQALIISKTVLPSGSFDSMTDYLLKIVQVFSKNFPPGGLFRLCLLIFFISF